LKNLFHIVIVSLLTLVTQIGGIIWILNFSYFKRKNPSNSRLAKISSFIVLYLIFTFGLIPIFAKQLGRTPLPILKSGNLIPHNLITPLLNRHYVKPQLKAQLTELSNKINSKNNSLKVSYLDANFPFIDGFPLLPHLSHSDGRKVDLSFYYTKDKKVGNLKPSNSGYGKFVEPTGREHNQTNDCKARGYWQYDFTKYITLGSRNDLEFDQNNTKKIIDYITSDKKTQMVLIEPHLKKRMNLTNKKIRFHGCHAVRHDDHIHFQIYR